MTLPTIVFIYKLWILAFALFALFGTGRLAFSPLAKLRQKRAMSLAAAADEHNRQALYASLSDPEPVTSRPSLKHVIAPGARQENQHLHRVK